MTGQLSPDQVAALDRLVSGIERRERVMTLVGPAGSGKSTVMKALRARAEALGRRVVFAAPTGKAALRLRDVAGGEAATLHGLLYTSVTEVPDAERNELYFGGRKDQLKADDVVVVDEASMVNVWLLNDLLAQLPEGAVLLGVGDREQLPPVSGTWGFDLQSPTAALTQIHRQAADNPIVSISADIRGGADFPSGSIGEQYARTSGTVEGLARWWLGQHAAGRDAVVLTATHSVREPVNELVRRHRGFTGPLVVGERLRVCLNNHKLGLMNGEIVDVVEVGEIDEDECLVGLRTGARTVTARVNPLLIGRRDVAPFKAFLDAWAKTDHARGVPGGKNAWVHVDYGYALTVHASQGSEFEAVAYANTPITWGGVEMRRRLHYTAVTRARQRLRIVDIRSAA